MGLSEELKPVYMFDVLILSCRNCLM